MRGDKIESKAKFEYDNRRSVSDRFCCPAYSDTIADPDVGNQRGDCCNSSDASDPRHDTLQRNLAGAGYPVQRKDRIHDFRSHFLPEKNLLRLKPVIYIAMLIAYALLLPHIGFIISSLLLSNGILLYFGTRKWWFYAIASANVIVAYFAFQAMSVTLP